MQASYLQPSPLAWEEVGHITVPRPAGGDQRLRLAQGPGKSAPSLCQPLSAKQRSVCSAWTPSPIPGLTQPRLAGGSTPGQVQSQKPGTVPKGGRSKSTKGAKLRRRQGPQPMGLPPSPDPGSKEGGPERLPPQGCLDLPTRQRMSENPGSRRGSGRNWSRVPGPDTRHQPFPWDLLGLRGWGGR